MDEFLNFFGSVRFFGILLLVGSVAFLLIPNVFSWFEGNPRRFWFARLTYKKPDDQAFVRSTWLIGAVLLVIGSSVLALNNPDIPAGIGWVLFDIVYWFLFTWIFIKVILLVFIVSSTLWNWIVNGTPLSKKSKTP